jgi:hypothetical protein
MTIENELDSTMTEDVVVETIVCEKDPYKGEAYCIECFGPKNKKYFFFYNSQGPFCCKRCYADFLNVEYESLPNVRWEGVLK